MFFSFCCKKLCTLLGCVFIMWKKSCELASFRKNAMTYVGNIM